MSKIMDLAQELDKDPAEIGSLILKDMSEDDIRSYYDEEPSEAFLGNNYFFDGDNYLFSNIKDVGDFYIPVGIWQGIVRDYVLRGNNRSLQELSIKYQIPFKILDACRRRYGLAKRSPVSTLERINDSDNLKGLNSIVYNDINSTQTSYEEEYDKQYSKAIKDKYEKLLSEKTGKRFLAEDLILGFKEAIKNYNPPEITRIEPKTDFEWKCHAPILDVHIGKFVWAKQDWGNDYDLKIACDRIKEHGSKLHKWIQERGGRCTDLYLSDIGDTIHSTDGKTDRGTYVGQDTRNRKVAEEAYQARVWEIDLLKSVADKIHIHLSYGNHAAEAEYYLYKMIGIRYNNDPQVIVSENSLPQNYFLVGDTLHLLDHGNNFPKNVASDAARAIIERVAREVSGDDYPKAKRIVAYLGHLHEEQSSSDGSRLTIKRLEAMCETDEYSTENRWAGNPLCHFFVLDECGKITDDHLNYFHEE